MTTVTSALDAVEHIERAHLVAASRFIEAIVDHDPLSQILGFGYQASESERLWDRFIERYNDVATGAYAMRGSDALHMALTSL